MRRKNRAKSLTAAFHQDRPPPPRHSLA
jgi:hypothetical protein